MRTHRLRQGLASDAQIVEQHNGAEQHDGCLLYTSSSVMLPLFLPEGLSFDKLLRALIGVILFQSAYIAEVVRLSLIHI